MKLGFTYSDQYSNYLGLDPYTTLAKILDDYKFDTVRLCVYWNQVEPKKNKIDFSSIDKQLEICKKHNVSVILAMGRKVPRWPEFHEPKYVKNFLNQNSTDAEEYLKERLFNYLEKTINRYNSEKIISVLQIENEPFFSFGESSLELTKEFYKNEIDFVKTLTAKTLMSSDSFNKGNYRDFSGLVDYLGLNLYFTVWSDTEKKYIELGNSKLKHNLKRQNTKLKYIISELQAEPWGNGKGLLDMTTEEKNISMNSNRLVSNYNWAKGLKVEQIWFWGVEYWEYLAKRGASDLKNTALKMLSTNKDN